MPKKKTLKSKDSCSSFEDARPEKTVKETPPSQIKTPIASKIPSYFSSPSPSSKQTVDVNKEIIVEESHRTAEQSKSSSNEAIDFKIDANSTDPHPNTDKDAESPKSKETKHKTSGLHQLLLSPKDDSNSQPAQKRKSAKSKNKSKKQEETSKQSAITEHFVVRRSQRKCKSAIEEEKRKSIESAILEGKEDGLEVREVDGKGRGVFALNRFERGDLVCEYAGDLIDFNSAKEREKKYSENKDIGCYMYYFSFGNKKYCVDATLESGRLGRLLNHSIHGNCTTKVISIKETPCLTLVAAKNIKPGEELLYDYGERDKEAIATHPWLQQ